MCLLVLNRVPLMLCKLYLIYVILVVKRPWVLWKLLLLLIKCVENRGTTVFNLYCITLVNYRKMVASIPPNTSCVWLAYFSLSALYVCAISGTRGSSGFGSHSREQMESRTAREEQHHHTFRTSATDSSTEKSWIFIVGSYDATETQEIQQPLLIHTSVSINYPDLNEVHTFCGCETFLP